MPLHDWRDERGWDGVHLLWLAQLLDWIQPRLPSGFRAYVGSVPALTLETGNGKPDVKVRGWREPPKEISTSVVLAPDRESVATFTPDSQRALHVDWHGQLIAAIELVSPRNKDRQDSKARYARRYLGYLRQGVHLMLVDVFAQPIGFSFADAISDDLGLGEPPMPSPFAVSYRVGSPVPHGDAWAPRSPAGADRSRRVNCCRNCPSPSTRTHRYSSIWRRLITRRRSESTSTEWTEPLIVPPIHDPTGVVS